MPAHGLSNFQGGSHKLCRNICSQSPIFSFEYYVDFWPEIYLILYSSLENLITHDSIFYVPVGDFRHQGIKILGGLQFLGYLRSLNLKFQKARTKIEVVLSLPCCLSQRKVLKYSRNCSLHNTLIPNFVKPLIYILLNIIIL